MCVYCMAQVTPYEKDIGIFHSPHLHSNTSRMGMGWMLERRRHQFRVAEQDNWSLVFSGQNQTGCVIALDQHKGSCWGWTMIGGVPILATQSLRSTTCRAQKQPQLSGGQFNNNSSTTENSAPTLPFPHYMHNNLGRISQSYWSHLLLLFSHQVQQSSAIGWSGFVS